MIVNSVCDFFANNLCLKFEKLLSEPISFLCKNTI